MKKPKRKQPSQDYDDFKHETSLSKKKGSPPGRTIESVEAQLIGLANELAKKQMMEGKVSAQVQTHFLKLGSSLAKLETEKLKHENSLLEAKTEALKSQKKMEELYLEAIAAMRKYGGGGSSFVEGSIVEEDLDND